MVAAKTALGASFVAPPAASPCEKHEKTSWCSISTSDVLHTKLPALVRMSTQESSHFARTHFERCIKIKQKAEDAIYNYFVKYGPPYNQEYGGCLFEECQDPKVSLLDVHSLLNDGGDPRIGNPKDYNNAPMHYAARYCNLRLCKMLKAGGADPSQVNELGQTVLSVATLFNAPEPRRKQQIRLVEWLLHQGCQINHVDKGGHTALDFAAIWGNLPLVSFLLQHNAKVYRQTEFLAIHKPANATQLANAPEIKDLVKVKEDQERTRSQLNAQAHKDKLARRAARLNAFKRKALVAAQVQERNLARRDQMIKSLARRRIVKPCLSSSSSASKESIHAEKLRHLKMLEDKDAHNGVWRYDANISSWTFVRGFSEAKATEHNVLSEAQTLLDDTQGLECKAILQKRWREMTGLDLSEQHPLMKPRASSHFMQHLDNEDDDDAQYNDN